MSFTQMKANRATHDLNANLTKEARHNVHAPGIKKSLWLWMNRWYEMEGKDRFAAQDGSEESDRLAIVDLECANGEVSDALYQWYHIGRQPPAPPPSSFSAQPDSASTPSPASAATAPPPPPQLQTTLHPLLQTNMKSALASRPAFIPPSRRPKPSSAAPPSAPAPSSTTSSTTLPSADPNSTESITTSLASSSITDTPASNSTYADASSLTGGQYASLVRPPSLPQGWKALEILPVTTGVVSEGFPTHLPKPVHFKFRQIAHGRLPLPTSYTPSSTRGAYPKNDMLIASFALHLVEPSELTILLTELSLRSDWLVVLSGGKKPYIRNGSAGWVRWDFGRWEAEQLEEEEEEEEGEEDDEEGEKAGEMRSARKREEEKEGLPPSAIELRRDRVRMRVYRSLNKIA